VAEWISQADTMMFCLSKGLGAPIGSVLCGPAELMREGRRIQILFGGAWRQAGVVAAAGLVALEDGRARLTDDHLRAKRLATGIAEISPGAVDPADVVTNMVFVDTDAVGIEPQEAVERLAALGVGAVPVPRAMRMVTHLDVDDDGIAFAIDAWRSVAGSVAATHAKGD
jgi:threonine aldolase